VLVSELRSTVTDDDIAIGSVADRCLLSGVKQTSHFKGVRAVFDPIRTLAVGRGAIKWPSYPRAMFAFPFPAGSRMWHH
jgi:hypothetical protein